jgi:hypothetical protein
MMNAVNLARKKHRCGYSGVAISKENILKQTPQPIAKAKQIRSRISAPCNYQDHKKRPVGKIDPVELDLMVFDDDYMMTCSDRICSQCGNDHSFKNNFKDVKTSIDALSELLFPKYLTSSTKSDYPKHEEETF